MCQHSVLGGAMVLQQMHHSTARIMHSEAITLMFLQECSLMQAFPAVST